MSALPMACPQCGQPNLPGAAFCEKCGASLTSVAPTAPAFGGGPMPISTPVLSLAPAPGFSVGIWGTKASGKTMYLYMLQDHITNTRSPTWQLRPENEQARNFLNRAVETIDHHEFPPATGVTQPEECLFKFTKREQHGKDREYIMRVLDMPGEWYQKPESALDASGKNVLQEYLKECQGLLCLIDPDRDENEPMMSYLRILFNNLYFERKQQLDTKIAFCLTKMDEPQHRLYLNDPRAYIQKKLGSRMIKTIEDSFVRGKVSFEFACSAVGFYPGIKPLRSNSGINWYGEGVIYDIHEIRPFGLFDPLEKWLFAP